MNPRLIGLGVTALLALGGSGRLVYNEVRLASTDDVTAAQARYRQDDATRASRLTLELAAAQGSIGDLTSAVAVAEGATEAVRSRAVALKREHDQLREQFSASTDEIARRAVEVDGLQTDLRRAQSAEVETRAELKARELALEAAQTRLKGLQDEQARLARALSEAERQGQFLAQELTRSEQAVSEARAAQADVAEDLLTVRERLDATQTELADAMKRASQNEAVVKALQDAGVDVARLSGADPMPLVRGFVVRVDTAAVPPVVLVHVGAQSGLRAGDRLFAVRKGRRVATLEVDGVEADICTTRVVIGDRGLQLAPRDEVFSWRPER